MSSKIFWRLGLSLGCLACVGSSFAQETSFSTNVTSAKRGSFYPIYNSGAGQWIEPTAQMPFKQIDFLYIAFSHIYPTKNGLGAFMDLEGPRDANGEYHEKTNLSQLVQFSRQQNKDIKLIISVGWGHQDWSYVQNDFANRVGGFVPSVVKFIRDNKLDGIDIDDESIGSNLSDCQASTGCISDVNFDSFIRELRTALNQASQQDRKAYYITITPAGDNPVGAANYLSTHININNIKYFDLINLQSYWAEDWSKKMQAKLQSVGYPLHKISYGINAEKGCQLQESNIVVGTGIFSWNLSEDSKCNYAITQQISTAVQSSK